MLFLNKKINVSLLLNEIKKLKLKNSKELTRVNVISDSIYSEWSKVKNKCRKLNYKGKQTNKKVFVNYEVEEELLVGLLVLLNGILVCRLHEINKGKD